MQTLILLATYNGEKYLSHLLSSIMAQDHTDWQLWIQDDGSQDKTLEVVAHFSQLDSRIQYVGQNKGEKGAKGNFSTLLEKAYSQSSFPYIAFADQDDLWHPSKLSTLLNLLKGEESPTIVFSDLELIDSQGKRMKVTFWEQERVSLEEELKIPPLLSRNIVPGCAMVFNRKLLELAVPLPVNISMHDWWILLVAVLLGKAKYTTTPLTYYRQHGSNDVGSRDRSFFPSLFRFLRRPLFIWRVQTELYQLLVLQALELLQRYELLPEQREILETFVKIRQGSIWHRLRYHHYFRGPLSVKLPRIFFSAKKIPKD